MEANINTHAMQSHSHKVLRPLRVKHPKEILNNKEGDIMLKTNNTLDRLVEKS